MSKTASSSPDNSFDQYIGIAFEAAIFLLILLLPTVLGHFFGLNEKALQVGSNSLVWPRRGWTLVLSALAFTIMEIVLLSVSVVHGQEKGVSTAALVHTLASFALMILLASLLQLIALLLISATQRGFIQAAAESSHSLTAGTMKLLLHDYEKIRQGVGPFYALAFSLHAPIILCFAFFGLAHPESISTTVRSLSCVAWSSVSLAYICLMSEDCYNAVQGLLPSIRYSM